MDSLVLLPGKSHGRRSLVGCSTWGRQESDTTERLHFHFSLSCFGEGNGSPLQCSCLENPRDGGAWWAAVYGVTQSWTRLKWQQQQQICNGAWASAFISLHMMLITFCRSDSEKQESWLNFNFSHYSHSLNLSWQPVLEWSQPSWAWNTVI